MTCDELCEHNPIVGKGLPARGAPPQCRILAAEWILVRTLGSFISDGQKRGPRIHPTAKFRHFGDPSSRNCFPRSNQMQHTTNQHTATHCNTLQHRNRFKCVHMHKKTVQSIKTKHTRTKTQNVWIEHTTRHTETRKRRSQNCKERPSQNSKKRRKEIQRHEAGKLQYYVYYNDTNLCKNTFA